MEIPEVNDPKSKMTIIDGICWKCNLPMKVAVTDGDGMSSHCGPDEFTETEIKFAESKGVIIKLQNSKTAGESYLANSCPHCNTFVGGFYLFTQYIQPADMGEFKYSVYEI